MSNALVLGGGSVKGAFQAGAISEILKKGFVPDSIYGVSVGALNGAFLANEAGKAKRESKKIDWPTIADNLLNFWKSNVTSNKSLGYEYSGWTIGWDIYFNTFDSLLNTDKLKELIKQTFDVENLRQNAVKFFAGVVNIGSGEYSDIAGDSQDLIEYITASAAIPIVMPIQEIGGQLLLDGGLRNVAPLGKAISDGAEKIVVVLCQPKDMNTINLEKRNLAVLADRVTDIMSNEIVNNDIKTTRLINEFCLLRKNTKLDISIWKDKRYVDPVIVRPDKDLNVDITKFDEAKISDLIKLGQIKGREAKIP